MREHISEVRPVKLPAAPFPLHRSASLGIIELVEVTERIQCPFCGQHFELVIDTSTASQQFVTDCEVCCRPFQVLAECEPGQILSLDVRE